MAHIVVTFRVEPHHAELLRGALSAVWGTRLLASTMDLPPTAGYPYAVVDATLEVGGVADYEVNQRLGQAAHAVERISQDAMPWEVEIR